MMAEYKGRSARRHAVIWFSLLVVVGSLALVVTHTQAAVTLVYFRAVGHDQAVELQWETATEIDNAGFFIIRSDQITGTYERVSDFIFTESPDPLTGATYVYTNTNLTNGVKYWYKLEAVDINQHSTFSAPVFSIPGGVQPTPTRKIFFPILLLLVHPGPDLALTKMAFPTSVLVGDRITFTLRIDNLGTVTATNLVVTDTLPFTTSVSDVLVNRQVIGSSLVPTNSTFIFTGTPTWGIWQVPSLAPKATAQAQFTALVSFVATRNATYSNTIGLEPISPPDPNPNNDKAIVYFKTDLIRVSGQVWNEREWRGIPGATVVLTDSASHTYSAISDSAGNYIFNSSTTTPIAAGRSLVKATATGYRMDPAPSVFTTTLGSLSVQNINMVYAPELEITKVASLPSVVLGETVFYTITVSNTGRVDASSVVITDTFPTGLTYQNDTIIPSSGSITRTITSTNEHFSIIWQFATLRYGEKISFQVFASLDDSYPINSIIINQVSVGSITPDEVPTNNTASANFTVRPIADLPTLLLKIARRNRPNYANLYDKDN